MGGTRQQEWVLLPGGGEGARLGIWEFQVLSSKGPGLSGRDFGTGPHSARVPLTVLGRGCSLSPLRSHGTLPSPSSTAGSQTPAGRRVPGPPPRSPGPLGHSEHSLTIGAPHGVSPGPTLFSQIKELCKCRQDPLGSGKLGDTYYIQGC